MNTKKKITVGARRNEERKKTDRRKEKNKGRKLKEIERKRKK
jgi:hypothetical protein